MEVMLVETTATNYIKPSSQTPPHLRIYNLSGMDQINPAIYGPVILFFPPPATRPQQPDDRSLLLKQSLSDTLSRYYALAGKFRDDGLSIDCCDAAAGAYYAEARIVNNNITLSQFLAGLNLAALKHLFPLGAVANILSPPPPGSPVVLLQVTWFPCGGASIGLLAAHRVIDASSIGCFLRAWGAAAAALIRKQTRAGGDDGSSGAEGSDWNPEFGGDSIFPRNEMPLAKSPSPGPAATATERRRKPVVTRRFVFSAAGLASLKENLTGPISRVQAVTALLCVSIMRAFTAAAAAPPSAVVVTQAVDLRRKASPPFPSNSIGNYVINAVATIDPREIKTPSCLVKPLIDSVARRTGGEFVSRIQGRAGAALLAEAAAEEQSAVAGRRRISFTSWSRLGLYDADFGWGKTAWMGCLPSDEADGGGGGGVVDLVMIYDTKDGSGLEAWVFLEGNEMGMLEKDEKLLSFACLDPMPLFAVDLTYRSRL